MDVTLTDPSMDLSASKHVSPKPHLQKPKKPKNDPNPKERFLTQKKNFSVPMSFAGGRRSHKKPIKALPRGINSASGIIRKSSWSVRQPNYREPRQWKLAAKRLTQNENFLQNEINLTTRDEIESRFQQFAKEAKSKFVDGFGLVFVGFGLWLRPENVLKFVFCLILIFSNFSFFSIFDDFLGLIWVERAWL